MAEPKTSCPKCAGHVAFPKELGGQTVDCPHCGESILLPKQKLPAAWIIAGVFGTIIVYLAGVLVWERLPKKSAKPDQVVQSPVPNPAFSQSEAASRNHSGAGEDSEDIQAMVNLCKEFYNALNNQDAKALRELMSESCRTALTLEDLKKLLR